MSRAKTTKRVTFLKPISSDILVCQNSNFKPYIESFFYEPENLTQKKIGVLFGVLEITDYSEDSSYIVNFLISTIKKEFYKNSKRGSIESLESALHKANLALSKLAQHENINWINNINATVGIFEKNNLHISSAGKGAAIIIRENNLIQLTDALEEKNETNPLKTFEDIVSGKIEKKDKLIIATPEIFDIFSLQEIKKSAQRFSQEEFVRFFKTALSNELERIAILLLDFNEKGGKKTKRSKKKSQDKVSNVFSQKAFESEKKSKSRQAKSDLEKSKSKEKPSPKNHLYIKEDLEDIDNEKTNKLNIGFQKARANFLKIKESFSIKILWKKPALKLPRTNLKYTLLNFFSHLTLKIRRFFFFLFKSSKRFVQKGKQLKSSIQSSTPKAPPEEKLKIPAKIPASPLHSLVPSAKRIIFSFNSLSPRKKVMALIIVALIFILPFFLARKDEKEILNQPTGTGLEEQKEDQALTSPNQQSLEYLSGHSEKGNNSNIAILNSKLFVIGENYLFDLEKQEKIDFPSEFGSIVEARAMDDLNLILLLSQDKKVVSFSPDSKKFQDNLIELPEDSQLNMAGTYMTYLYFVDEKDNQIFRYPRAEGGFGEKTNWLSENVDLSSISSSAINENIYLISQNKLFKFFRGKKADFSLSEEIKPDLISTQEEDESFYVLDKTSKKIFIFGNDGALQKEFSNEAFSQAKDMKSDLENKALYVLLEDGEIVKFGF